MESGYKDADAAKLVAELDVGETLALRTYTARLLGRTPELVVHGGGNTSAKDTARDRFGREMDVLYIKGSGWDLATIAPAGHPAVRLEPLRALRALEWLSDEEMVAELRTRAARSVRAHAERRDAAPRVSSREVRRSHARRRGARARGSKRRRTHLSRSVRRGARLGSVRDAGIRARAAHRAKRSKPRRRKRGSSCSRSTASSRSARRRKRATKK